MRILKVTGFLIIFIFSLMTSCKHRPGAPVDVSMSIDSIPPEFNAEIVIKTAKFTQAHITRDTAFLNACFTRDARIMPPNALVVEGLDSISKLNEDWVNYGLHDFVEKSSRMYGCGDLIVDEGIYLLRYGPTNTTDEGKYLNIWKKEDGIWKIHANMWNTSLPLVELD